MKMTTLRIKQVLAACLCFFSMGANAQFTASVEQDANTDYSLVAAKFKLTDVATQLGTDTTTLSGALSSWINDTSQDPIFFLQDPNDPTVLSSNYTQGGQGGFWINRDGSVGTWGQGAVYYNTISFDTNADEFDINLGQFPDSLKDGAVFTPTFVLQYGGAQATFTVTYTVNKLPDAPDAETFVPNLNIVGNAEVSIEQYPRSGYDADAVYVNISDAAEKLGTNKKMLRQVLSKIVYQQKVDATYRLLSDSLVLISTNDGWSKRALAENGDTLQACGNALYSSDDAFFIQSFAYDENSDTLSCNLGQYPNSLHVGDQVYTDAYIVFGSNAYKVRYNLSIVESPYHGLDDMTQVGDTVISVSQPLYTSYEYTSIKPNVDGIAAALGTTASNMSLQGIDSNNSLSSNSTANNGGYWMTSTGIITSWGGTAAFFIEPSTSGDYSDLHVGQYPNAIPEGDSAYCVLYFVSGEKYYSMHVTLNIEAGTPVDPNAFESVATRSIVVQQLVDNNYTFSDAVSIPQSEIQDLLGITEPTLYGLNEDSLVAKGKDKYTKSYTCTPYPGFWLTKEGTVHSWDGSNSPWGMCLAYNNDQAQFTCIQMQNIGTTAGTTYQGQFFLINEETSKMITINLTYQIVETLEQVEQVGSENVTVQVNMDDTSAPVDVAKASTALGMPNAATLLGGYYLRGKQANGLWTDGADPVNMGILFGTDGYAAEGGTIGLTFESDGTAINVYSNAEIDPNFKMEGSVCFQVDNKRYVYNITFLGDDAYNEYITGINGVKVDAANGKIFDLSGRQVNKPVKGVYIQNGKKYIVK